MQLLNDIRQYPGVSKEKQILLIAFLIALSGILSILDYAIPKPIPFSKIGIANIITLLLIVENRYALAVQVAISRVVLTGLIVGTFLSYTFLLSIAGAIGATFSMIAIHRLLKSHLSPIGISVAGAFISVICQGLVVAAFFGADKGTLGMVSIMLLIGIANGVLVGWLLNRFYKQVDV